MISKKASVQYRTCLPVREWHLSLVEIGERALRFREGVSRARNRPNLTFSPQEQDRAASMLKRCVLAR